jgi:hypothetical protein
MSQAEALELINLYNNTNRQVIKKNLKRIMIEKNIKAKDIINLGYAQNNTYAWTNLGSINIPMFDQALNIAVSFNFDVKELLKTD